MWVVQAPLEGLQHFGEAVHHEEEMIQRQPQSDAVYHTAAHQNVAIRTLSDKRSRLSTLTCPGCIKNSLGFRWAHTETYRSNACDSRHAACMNVNGTMTSAIVAVAVADADAEAVGERHCTRIGIVE